MVRTHITQPMKVEVTIVRSIDDGGDRIIACPEFQTASDAFDYHTQAIGYFRFAIQDMDCTRIDVEVFRSGECIELTSITRDEIPQREPAVDWEHVNA